ncbi:FAD-binding oxidoreductase [Paenibacillus sp. R14(2021)]|uniref:NAD(P)/FAD-dependent oxidoreductase n=1 Tax=Paenibacillus sp. R14(2021) TaxID=2859228 RepID=UPI001C615CE0|nr:FAD-dependent oxidoreductase [Paenibacillus sp. R14(2021)]
MKDLHEGRLFWPDTLPQCSTYPPLQGSLLVDAAIVGGGMSGAICAFILARSGLKTVLLERGSAAGGSSLANTGLLQFCNDLMLTELTEQIGEHSAAAFYKGCAAAVQELGAVAGSLSLDAQFQPRSSLYYASSEQDVPKLKAEYAALRKNGFDVAYWEPEQIQARFPFKKPGAMLTQGDALVNPYRFVHGVIDDAASKFGLLVHEKTDITAHEQTNAKTHVLHTAAGASVHAKYVIYAVGYEPEELRGQLVKAVMNRTSVIVTEPQADLSPWYEQVLIWETARPYFYARLTADGRVVAGGYDEEALKPLTGEVSRAKIADKLSGRVKELFPSFRVHADYEWNATFCQSRDYLPFIGEDPKRPGIYYCLGYGGNGTVYSMMGANILSDLIQGRSNELAPIVALDRPTLQNV